MGAGPAGRVTYAAASRLDDIDAFLAALAKSSPLVRVHTFGTSEQGRPMPLVTLSNPAVARPADLRAGRPVVFILANIHGGEVEGKEALQSLLRDLERDQYQNVVDSLVIVAAPMLTETTDSGATSSTVAAKAARETRRIMHILGKWRTDRPAAGTR